MAELLEIDGVSLRGQGFGASTRTGRYSMPARRGENMVLAGRSGSVFAKNKPYEEGMGALSLWAIGAMSGTTTLTNLSTNPAMTTVADVTTTNLVPNPRAGTDTSGWWPNSWGQTIARSTTGNPFDLATSVEMTWPVAYIGGNNNPQYDGPYTEIPASSGVRHALFVVVASADMTVAPALDQQYVGRYFGPITTLRTGVPTVMRVSGTEWIGGPTFPFISAREVPAGATLKVALIVTAGEPPDTYFDGSYANRVANPLVPTDLTGWSSNGTLVRDGTPDRTMAPVPSVNVTPTVNADCYVSVTTTGGTIPAGSMVRVSIFCYAGGTLDLEFGGLSVRQVFPQIAGFHEVVAEGVTVADMTGFTFILNGATVGGNFYLSRPYVRVGSGPGGNGLHTYAWGGTAHASTSVRVGPYYKYARNHVANPFFRASGVGWAPDGVGGTLSSPTTTSRRVTMTGSGNSGFYASGLIPVTPGSVWSARITAELNTAKSVNIVLYWFNVGGGTLSSSTATFALSPNIPTVLSVSGTAPSGVSYAVLSTYGVALIPGDALTLSLASVGPGAVAPEPFDGSSTADDTYAYSWSGPAHASESVRWVTPLASSGGGVLDAIQFRSGNRMALEPVSASLLYASHRVWYGFQQGQYMTVRADLTIPTTLTGPLLAQCASVSLTAISPSSPGGYVEYYSSGGSVAGSRTVTVSGWLPADTNYIEVRLYNGATNSAVNRVIWDNLVIVASDKPYTGPYFDGDTADDAFNTYSWSGTAHASSSSRTMLDQLIIPDTAQGKRQAFEDNMNTFMRFFTRGHKLSTIRAAQPDGSVRRALVEWREWSEPDVHAGGTRAEWAVAYTIPDTWWEDESPTAQVSPTGSATLPKTLDLTSFTGMTGVIENATLIVRGPITNPRITDPETGSWVQYTGTVGAGQDWYIVNSTFTTLMAGSPAQTAVTHAGSYQYLIIPNTYNGTNTPRLVLTGSGASTATFFGVAEARRKWVNG